MEICKEERKLANDLNLDQQIASATACFVESKNGFEIGIQTYIFQYLDEKSYVELYLDFPKSTIQKMLKKCIKVERES